MMDKQALKKERNGPRSRFPHLVTIILAEILGTALLMFIGCMGCITEISPVPIPSYFPGLTFGLTVLLIIQMFGHISGAHLNPVVTIGAFILGQIKINMILPYFIGEYLGALLGFWTLLMVTPTVYTTTQVFDEALNTTITKPGICNTLVNDQITIYQGLAIEALISGVLILVCAAVWDKRNSDKTDSTALRFGCVIAAISMAAGPFTGASMNPARSLAPALLNNNWSNHWVFWVGPFGGGIISALVYKYLFQLIEEDETDQAHNWTIKSKIDFEEKTHSV